MAPKVILNAVKLVAQKSSPRNGLAGLSGWVLQSRGGELVLVIITTTRVTGCSPCKFPGSLNKRRITCKPRTLLDWNVDAW
jgi:hypothetical protein